MASDGEVYEEEAEVTEEVMEDEAVDDAEATATATAAATELNDTINVDSFEELRLTAETVADVKTTWFAYINGMPSREAAGESIYAALFDAAPSLQSLFKTPRAVMAMRFMNGISSMINVLGEPEKLKIQVETLGFQHLDLEVTAPRVIIFRDAIVDLLTMELGAKMSTRARAAISGFLGYVGGAYIYIKKTYAGRIRIIATSWATANNKKFEADGTAAVEGKGGEEGEAAEGEGEAGNMDEQDDKLNMNRNSDEAADNKKKTGNLAATKVPTTYGEMFVFNAAVMGFGGNTWMSEVLASFDTIVSNVSNSYRLQEECDVLSLRLANTRGNIVLAQYKAVMLASLRSLVPKDWNSAHEVAWGWLWENVERMLTAQLGKPSVMQQNLGNFLTSLDEVTQGKVRRSIYGTFFAMAPAGQDFFKQSTTRLYFIADRVLEMTLNIFKDPIGMSEDISALGLRHVGYAVPTELFGAFVSACIQVIRDLTGDEKLETAFGWSLGLISRMLVRTILEGSTIVMKAINQNSAKQLRKAVSCAPRGKRASWMLNITVGTQSISPLMWSIESGALDAAGAIVRDLLTIRADRDRYYYAVDDLFGRHEDVILRLCQDARGIVSVLLDGLVWRSRYTEQGRRRVNYFVKHLLIDSKGSFNNAMSWIVDMKDPKIVCHPLLVLLSDTVWNGPVIYTFLSLKAWLWLMMTLYIIAQSILKSYGHNEAGLDVGNATRIAVFVFRVFVYVFCCGQLIIYHSKVSIEAYKNKETVKIRGVLIPEYLLSFQEYITVLQALTLLLMLALCPKLWCMGHWWEDYYGYGVLTDHCPQAHHAPDHIGEAQATLPYGILSTVTMLIFFARMVDLAVVNNTVSAYVIMSGQVMVEVALFLLALGFVIVAWACSVEALFELNTQNFDNVADSMLSYLSNAFGLFNPTEYELIYRSGGWIYLLFILFIITVHIFLINLLIAQICSAHQAVYLDIIGYARMRRIISIYQTMPYVTSISWEKWITTLGLDERLEFNMGDIGLAGGMQVKEPANANITIVDSIRRFGGSTSPAVPWPQEEEDGDEQQGFERLEKLMQRVAKKVEGGGGKKRGKGGSSGMGSSGAGSTGKSAGSEEAGGEGEGSE